MEDLESIVLNCSNWELDNLADFIVTNHHQYVRKSVLAIEEQSTKLGNQYSRYPQLQKITEVFQKAASNLCENMNEEEQILFPYIRFQVHIKKGNIARSFLPSGSIIERITHMEKQHTSVMDDFKIIRELTNNYQDLAYGYGTFSVLYQMLKEFDNDLKQHFYLETKLLFSKAIQMEKDYLQKPEEMKTVSAKIPTEVTSILL